MLDKILRILPTFKGKQRLARLLLKSKFSCLRDVLIQGKYDCTYKVPNIKESIGFELYINGVYEEEIINFIKRRIPFNGIFLDIGANIGAITMPLIKQRKDIKATCIEASLNVFSCLRFNTKNNQLHNCNLVNKAVTDIDGDVVSFFSPPEQFGKGSLSSVFTEDAEYVETITLDTLVAKNNILKVNFIKIDIEGYEYYAFKGGVLLLTSDTAPDILFEFVDWAEGLAKDLKPGDAQKLLIDYGYDLFIVSKMGKLTALTIPLTKGAAMIFASKKVI